MGRVANFGHQCGRRDDPAVLAEPQREPADPAGVRGAQHHPEPPVGQVGH